MKLTVGEKVFDVINYIFITLISFSCFYPFLYIASLSLSSSRAISSGEVFLWPVDFNLEAYKQLVRDGQIFIAMRNTVLLTVVGSALNMVATILCSYALSKKRMRGRGVFTFIIAFTMFFGGGMIPSFILIRNLKLMNTYWSLWLPGLISTYNMIVLRTFFQGIPESLEEAAQIDGAGDPYILFRIVLPLSGPALATITLFHAVVTGKGGIFVRGWITTADYKDMKQNVPTSDPVVVHPFTTSFGRFDDHLPRSGVSAILCLNRDSKNAEAYIKYVDWAISLGRPNVITNGFEGIDYRMVNGEPVPIYIEDEAARLQRQTETIYRGEYSILSGVILPLERMLDNLDPNDAIGSSWARAEYAARSRQLTASPRAFVPFPPASDVINTFQSTTETQISSIEANVFVGHISVDEGLRQINNIKNAAGVNAVNAEKDAWYQKNKALFESLKGLF
jgi:ABC-type glycerol-3-phosphate transport system permease component